MDLLLLSLKFQKTIFHLLIMTINICSLNSEPNVGEFPSNYPHYYNWSIETNSFQIGHIPLPSNARSLQPDFLTAPPTEKFRYHSQCNQDRIILNIFKDMENGYFIDLAANDWKTLSNTYVLEYYNKWKGICIEPNPQYHIPLLANRKCQLFINPVSSRNGESITFLLGDVGSGIIGEEFDNKEQEKGAKLELKTVTLNTILEYAKAPLIIQYFSLDVEGAEYAVLRGFDFKKYTFLVLTIERPKEKLHFLLLRHGYLFLRQLSDFGECMYVHHSLPSLHQTWQDYYAEKAFSGNWHNQAHEYLSKVKWNWNITKYLEDAEVAYHKHHPRSSLNP